MRRPHAWQRWVQRLVSTAPGSRLFSWFLHHVDAPLLRATGGRLSTSRLLAGVPTLLLLTREARSGKLRATPLTGVEVGDDVVLVASNWGGRRNPGWYHNLKAHPEATLQLHGRRRTCVAREVEDPEEYERLWGQAVETYAGYEAYRARAGRPIPLMLVSPAE